MNKNCLSTWARILISRTFITRTFSPGTSVARVIQPLCFTLYGLVFSLAGSLAYGMDAVPAAHLDTDSTEHWHSYGGDNSNSHYSSLSQIHSGNVAGLELAWTYRSARGEALPASSELQFNPIVVNGVLYGRNPNYNVFAIDAASGEELWVHEPAEQHVGLSNMRGVTYWQDPQGKNARLFFTTSHYLMAIDAANGKLVEDFGEGGVVDLRLGLRRPAEKISVNVPSPGIIYKNLLILGSAVNETRGAAPGDIRAYDVRSGERVWSFHTIPMPGEFGHDTWPEDAWKTAGGANAWAGLSLDAKRGVVYAPTGSPTPDFDGSGREGANLFSDSIIALNAATGERLWHYQAVHHDIWDRDLSSAPTLVTVNKDGKAVDMVAQASKQGVIYLLHRDTGEPVFPIEEVPVPGSQVPTEKPYPTQPRVTLPEPFARQAFTEDLITDINPKAHAHVKALFDEAQDFAYMQPIGLQPTIVYPGFYGGANWGGGAFDPETNLYYINAMEAPNLVQIEAVEVDRGSPFGFGSFVYKQHCSGCHGAELQGFYPYAPALVGVSDRLNKVQAMEVVNSGKGRMMPFSHLSRHEQSAALDYLYQRDRELTAKANGEPVADEPVADDVNGSATKKETVYMFKGYVPFVDDRYYPAVKPPWGTLNAIDLASGKRQWQVTLGEHKQLTAEGLPPTGTLNYGGPVVTKGGLLVIAATMDEQLRIFDKSSGELLWNYQLPAAGYSTPSTYSVNGRQYIVVACTGGKLGTPSGDQYMAFALSDSR